MHYPAALLLPAVLAAGCSAPPSPVDHLCTAGIASLREALAAGPEQLAVRFAAKGDLRFLEWYGFVSAIPGVSDQECVRSGNHSRYFEGTSDALCSSEHHALWERSLAFAERYNHRMLQLRAAAGMPLCNGAG